MAVRIMGRSLSTQLHIYASTCILMHMTDLKERRHRAIEDLIRAQTLANQEELAARLSSLGFIVTQATVSRDPEQISAVKDRRDAQISYALPEQISDPPTQRFV